MESFRSIFVPIFAYSTRSILWLLCCIFIGIFLGGLIFGKALDPAPLFTKRAAPESPIEVVEKPTAEIIEKPVSPPSQATQLKACQTQVNQAMANDQILFSVGQAEIRKTSHPVLNQLASLLLKCQRFTVRINGHTDNTGNDQLNITLSKRRAASVKDYFNRRGVSLSKMIITGYGSRQPIATNSTPEGRAKNRRIEMIFTLAQKNYKVEIL